MPKLTLDDAREFLRKIAGRQEGPKPDIGIMLLPSHIVMRTFNAAVLFEHVISEGLTIQSTLEEDGVQWHLESGGFRPEAIRVYQHSDDTQTVNVRIEECECFHHLNVDIFIPKNMTHEIHASQAVIPRLIGIIQLLQEYGATDIRIGIGASPYSPRGPIAHGVIDLGFFSVGDMGPHSSPSFMMGRGEGVGAPDTPNLASILYNSILRSSRGQTSPSRTKPEEQH